MSNGGLCALVGGGEDLIPPSSLTSSGVAGAGASASVGIHRPALRAAETSVSFSRAGKVKSAPPHSTFVRAPPGSSPPRDPSPIYLPWQGRAAIQVRCIFSASRGTAAGFFRKMRTCVSFKHKLGRRPDRGQQETDH